MMMDNSLFPVYRKYINNSSFFKIENEKYFTEVQLVGQQYFIHKIEAKQYPEMLRIQDMIKNEAGLWSEIEEYEFQLHFEKASLKK